MPFLSYRTVWRWHFYAGLFSIPFVLWLSATGSIYLFKPQIERWLDRPYDALRINGPRATPEQQTLAAVAAVPGSNLHYFELPATRTSATRIIVGRGPQEFRVYVHPQTLAILKVISEDRRPMRIIFRLHGELLAGDWGSRLVELAASWTIVLLLTGLYLWWPRSHAGTSGAARLAGVLYVRLRRGSRLFWRDLHAVTGVWVSVFALFLLLTGLPWAKSWGTWFKTVRTLGSHGQLVRQDWSAGRSSEIEDRLAMNRSSLAGLSMEHAGHMGGTRPMPMRLDGYRALDRLVPLVAAEHLAAPVLLMPPMPPSTLWTARSDAQDRPLRSTLALDPAEDRIVQREAFSQRPFLDRAVGIGVAAHEGQLFAPLNQFLGLATALGLITLSVSSVVLWWRRRQTGILGAPLAQGRQRLSPLLAVLVLGFGFFLPLLGASLALVLLCERLVLRRIPAAARWLGLQPV